MSIINKKEDFYNKFLVLKEGMPNKKFQAVKKKFKKLGFGCFCLKYPDSEDVVMFYDPYCKRLARWFLRIDILTKSTRKREISLEDFLKDTENTNTNLAFDCMLKALAWLKEKKGRVLTYNYKDILIIEKYDFKEKCFRYKRRTQQDWEDDDDRINELITGFENIKGFEPKEKKRKTFYGIAKETERRIRTLISTVEKESKISFGKIFIKIRPEKMSGVK